MTKINTDPKSLQPVSCFRVMARGGGGLLVGLISGVVLAAIALGINFIGILATHGQLGSIGNWAPGLFCGVFFILSGILSGFMACSDAIKSGSDWSEEHVDTEARGPKEAL